MAGNEAISGEKGLKNGWKSWISGPFGWVSGRFCLGPSCLASCGAGTPRSRSAPRWAWRRSSCAWRRRSWRSSCPRCRRRPFGAVSRGFFEDFRRFSKIFVDFRRFSRVFEAFEGFSEGVRRVRGVRAPTTRSSRCAGAFWSSWIPCRRRGHGPIRVHFAGSELPLISMC